MARGRGLGKYNIVGPVSSAPQSTIPLEQSAEGVNLLFGTRENQKTIAVIAAVCFVAVAIVDFLIAKDEQPFPFVALLFTALHGGLVGMLAGQLILVYSDLMVIICTAMAVVIGEVTWLAISGVLDTGFVLDRHQLQAIVAVFFWSGFLGFWVGFIAFAKRLSERRHFQKRFQGEDELPPSM